ncbi:MAG: hypothetical protein WCH83_09085 [Alphaproteobacteria bacterium]|jgi:hypothetical protein
MRSDGRRPLDLVRRTQKSAPARSDGFKRETFTLPREAARESARDYLTRFPKQAYMTQVDSWRELEDGRIEFTMRRLPSAD